ncbi:MAG: alpha/beta fold hydrolase [Candidatus Sericytochromatia bacterium]|nr:alpha/beta fold hydrolase [Candidatus Sericytochromatia bacterium]
MSARPNLPPWLDRELYPFRPRRFETPDGQMSYVDQGEGPVVLLLHGSPGWSFTWREVITDLSLDHRVIAPDMLGFGLSDVPAADRLRPGDHTRRLAALVAHLGLREITLVLHDIGGPVGLPLALLAPSPIARLVVLNSWCWPLGGESGHDLLRKFLTSRLAEWLYLDADLSTRWLMPLAIRDRGRLHRHVHGHYLDALAGRRRRVGTLAAARALVTEDRYYAGIWNHRDRLAALPMDIIWGLGDPWLGRRFLDRWREVFPSALVRELTRCGHFVPEEAPATIVRTIRGLES